MPDLIITNAKVFLNDFLQTVEIAIERGKITRVGKMVDHTDYDTVLDAKDSLVLPGAIDVHVHFRDPGLTKKEDWYTGSCAAAAGGVTSVIDHPNTVPPTIDAESFKLKLKKAKKKSIIDYGINGGVTGNIEKLTELYSAGAMAFGEIFMAESTGNLNISDYVLKQSLDRIKELGGTACIHAEDEAIRKQYVKLLKGDNKPESYSKSRPELSETKAIEKAIYLSGGCRTHICHISALKSVDIIKDAKTKNKGMTCEVAPHHLFLSKKDWERLGTFGKMNPPLRDLQSQQKLWAGLSDGTIDMVASDHAPHTESEKMADIWSAPAGVPGVENMLPLLVYAVKRNLLTLKRLIELTSSNPARVFELPGKGAIAPGYDADLVICGQLKKITGKNLHGKSRWTPFENMEGIFPAFTISRGEIVWDGDILAKHGRGMFLKGKGFVVEPPD